MVGLNRHHCGSRKFSYFYSSYFIDFLSTADGKKQQNFYCKFPKKTKLVSNPMYWKVAMSLHEITCPPLKTLTIQKTGFLKSHKTHIQLDWNPINLKKPSNSVGYKSKPFPFRFHSFFIYASVHHALRLFIWIWLRNLWNLISTKITNTQKRDVYQNYSPGKLIPLKVDDSHENLHPPASRQNSHDDETTVRHVDQSTSHFL